MPFTIIYALAGLLMLGVVFGVIYKWKGWKAAVIVTGAILLLILVGFVVLISLIISGM